MYKTLGLLETRSLVGAVAAADTMLKNTDIKIIGKERLASGEMILIMHGDKTSVDLALSIGTDKARELGQLKLSYIITEPVSALEKIFGDIFRTDKKNEDTAVNASNAPELSEHNIGSGSEMKAAEHDQEINMNISGKSIETETKKKDETDTIIKSNNMKREKSKKERGGKKIKHELPEDNFSLFNDKKNDTIARLRKEALGSMDLKEAKSEKMTMVLDKIETETSAEKEIQSKDEHLETDSVETFETEDILSMNVHKLRKLARGIDNFPIKGREISKANRSKLLGYFNNLK